MKTKSTYLIRNQSGEYWGENFFGGRGWGPRAGALTWTRYVDAFNARQRIGYGSVIEEAK